MMRSPNRFRRIAFAIGPFFLLAAAVAISRYALRTTPAPERTDAESVELKRLAGIWEVESVTLGGTSTSKNEPVQKYEINGQTHLHLNTEQVRIITLDLSTDPKRITLTSAELERGVPVPTADDQVYRGEYTLDGDKLTLVSWWKVSGLDFPPTPRIPKADDSLHVMVLKRLKN